MPGRPGSSDSGSRPGAGGRSHTAAPRGARPAWRQGCGHPAPRPDGDQVEGDAAPLQPGQQPRHLIGGTGGDEQSHPVPVQGDRSGPHPPPQHRRTRVGRQLQHVETDPREQPHRLPLAS
ncbi:hypothetical protein GTW66_19045 [Streptomyces sp. SID5473]|nr:hypothetical protein [Streptomyces sp. SID5473]